MKIKAFITILLSAFITLQAVAIDNKGITYEELNPERFTLLEKGTPTNILIDENEDQGVMIAATNLSEDFGRVSALMHPYIFAR